MPGRKRDVWPEIGARIRQLREEAGLTQDEVAAQLRLGRTSVANLEGGHQRVTLESLLTLAGLFGVPVHRVLPTYATANPSNVIEQRLRMRLQDAERRLARIAELAHATTGDRG